MYYVWKSSPVLCLFYRPKSICSSQHLLEVEIKKLKHLFYDYSYPTWFFGKIYNKFKAKLNDIHVDETSIVNNEELVVLYISEVSICFMKAFSIMFKTIICKADSFVSYK